MKENTYKIWLGAGMGSCGGDVSINNKTLTLDTSGTAKYPWKNGAKRCETTIQFTNKGAEVSDSCAVEGSTCDTDGSYTFDPFLSSH
ncbi:hypothetical protein LIN78_06200 [Leeia sp. TBRC 13508]|uniref:Uncharacterized protein n=1 Tax=Leeia speluncae TaxID=2884804 RepID=A0ABS8D4T2_9NEIS|nr:hypothetical protein [Leeia speluncae]MCB6183132.1 hypothetical protein [Leeia speluncae]